MCYILVRQSGSSWFYTIFVCSPFSKLVRFLVVLWLQSGRRRECPLQAAGHGPAAWLKAGLSENMEKKARLLSSQLVRGDRLVEVAANRTVLAWKEIKKDKNSSEISSFSKTGKSKTWRSNCSNNSTFTKKEKEKSNSCCLKVSWLFPLMSYFPCKECEAAACSLSVVHMLRVNTVRSCSSSMLTREGHTGLLPTTPTFVTYSTACSSRDSLTPSELIY